MGSKFTELIVDCTDPQRLAEFWSAVLGWQPTGRYAPGVELSDPAGSSPSLVFIPVPESKTSTSTSTRSAATSSRKSSASSVSAPAESM
jgi:hypothetical protein